MSRKLKLAGACLNQTPIDWENNLRNIKSAIEEAKYEGVDILCLPELCITGYGCEDLFLSQWLPEKALQKLAEILPETLLAQSVVTRLRNRILKRVAANRSRRVYG